MHACSSFSTSFTTNVCKWSTIISQRHCLAISIDSMFEAWDDVSSQALDPLGQHMSYHCQFKEFKHPFQAS